jgi:hypothetical protein
VRKLGTVAAIVLSDQVEKCGGCCVDGANQMQAHARVASALDIMAHYTHQSLQTIFFRARGVQSYFTYLPCALAIARQEYDRKAPGDGIASQLIGGHCSILLHCSLLDRQRIL